MTSGKGPPGTVRICAGRWKGRRLEVPPASRPTSARARESLFDILAGRIAGARVLDLYAGSGAVGIEAVSRGALRATLVERDAAVLRRNAALLSGGDALEILESNSADAIRVLASRGERFDIVFSDPPYGDAPSGAGTLPVPPEVRILVADSAVLVLQRDIRPGSAPMVTAPGFARFDERRYGRNVLDFYAPVPVPLMR